VDLKIKINYPEKINNSSWFHPFYPEETSKYKFIFTEKNDVDIVYNNIYDYTDTPISAYENEDSVLVPMPLYGKEINRKFNVIPVPLVMQHENWNITSNIELLNKLRTNTKKYDFTFVGDINDWRFDTDDDRIVDGRIYSEFHDFYYNLDDYLEVNREFLYKLKLDNFYLENVKNKIWDLSIEVRKNKVLEFVKKLSLSKFCFTPRGAGSSSYRLYESLMVGTIPIITGMKDYPFSDIVDWDSFSFRSDSQKDIDELVERAENLTDNEYKIMRQNGIDFWEQYCRLDNLHDWVIESFLLDEYR